MEALWRFYECSANYPSSDGVKTAVPVLETAVAYCSSLDAQVASTTTQGTNTSSDTEEAALLSLTTFSSLTSTISLLLTPSNPASHLLTHSVEFTNVINVGVSCSIDSKSSPSSRSSNASVSSPSHSSTIDTSSPAMTGSASTTATALAANPSNHSS